MLFKKILGVTFSSMYYLSNFFLIFTFGFTEIFSRHFNDWEFVMLLLVIPALGLFVLIAVHSASNAILSLFRREWAECAGHLIAPAIAVFALYFGLVAGETSAVAYRGLQLKSALAEFRAGIEPPDTRIEIISLNPEIAMYRENYVASFGSPGYRNLILLDQTGRFKELAAAGRARELAASDDLKARNYAAYCKNLVILHRFSIFYSAVLDDVTGCDEVP